MLLEREKSHTVLGKWVTPSCRAGSPQLKWGIKYKQMSLRCNNASVTHRSGPSPLRGGWRAHACSRARSPISARSLQLATRLHLRIFTNPAQSQTWHTWQRSNRFSCRRRRRREGQDSSGRGGGAVVYNLSRGEEEWAERLLSLLQVKIYFVFSGCEGRRWHWQKNALNSGREFIIEWHWLRLICWDESDCKNETYAFFFLPFSLPAPIPRCAMKY